GVRMILARRTRAGLGGSTPPQGIVALGEGQAGRGSAWRGRPPRRAAPEQGLAPDPGRGALRRTWRRWRTRRLIVTLDEHVLKDIGASRAEALAEYSKPFWRA
ncbi:MAG: DUF1127 domain-containing protein, partial [Acetobacteraceae bacterium]|nr:DUF1127 domain-containing protein [Acetobacteraceae bacterium]